MRSLLVFCLLALSAAFVLGSVGDPTTPGPTDGGVINGMCELKSLSLTGLTIVPTFDPATFFYQCSCDSTFTSTILSAVTLDSTSTAVVTFNGVEVGQAVGGFTSSPLVFVTGLNTIYVDVACTPSNCNYRYTIQCTKAPPTGPEVIGDPMFVGLKGQSYQVHGVSGEIYNIVSDSAVQYNSRFVFLDSGACPIINGKKAKGCFSHPGSYLGELGLKTRAGDKIHIVSGPAATGFAEVSVNEKQLAIGETVELAGNQGFLSLNNTHQITTKIGQWSFEFENSDMYVNQKVRVADLKSLRSHGLLGQTWRTTMYPNAIKHVQGDVDDYVIRSGDIYGDDFVYNTHN